MRKVVFFDLDGTLLPMNQEEFIKVYFGALAKHMAPYGYDPENLIAAIWKGTKAMIMNNGKHNNEYVFWEEFKNIFGEKAMKDYDKFDHFYRTLFDAAKAVMGFNPKAAETVKLLKEKGYRVVLATNPVFPKIAQEKRISWAGLNYNDFEYVTSYENSSYCKPNLDYYREIMDKIGVKPEDCMMVGNDVSEDMVTKQLGFETFLLTDCLINKNNVDIDEFRHGSFEDLINYINE